MARIPQPQRVSPRTRDALMGSPTRGARYMLDLDAHVLASEAEAKALGHTLEHRDQPRATHTSRPEKQGSRAARAGNYLGAPDWTGDFRKYIGDLYPLSVALDRVRWDEWWKHPEVTETIVSRLGEAGALVYSWRAYQADPVRLTHQVNHSATWLARFDRMAWSMAQQLLSGWH